MMTPEPFRFDHPGMLQLASLEMVLTASVQLHNQQVLEVVLAEALARKTPVDLGAIKNVRPIEIQPQSKKFSLVFHDFVSYAVTEEMFWHSRGETLAAKLSNGWVRQLTHSPFLNFVRTSTWADDYSDDALLHFQFVTLDHTIDVATTRPPDFLHASAL